MTETMFSLIYCTLFISSPTPLFINSDWLTWRKIGTVTTWEGTATDSLSPPSTSTYTCRSLCPIAADDDHVINCDATVRWGEQTVLVGSVELNARTQREMARQGSCQAIMLQLNCILSPVVALIYWSKGEPLQINSVSHDFIIIIILRGTLSSKSGCCGSNVVEGLAWL